MGWWSDHVLARVVDRALDAPEFRRYRESTCAGLTGDIVEIGFGSGLNVAHYPAQVRSVTAIEPSPVAWRLAQRRVGAVSVPVRLGGLDGQRLDLPDESFDGALSTFTLCTVPDVRAAVRELTRVLRPAATLHFLEHGLSSDPGVVRWQHRITPLQRRVGGGCHLDRSIAELVQSAGLRLESLETWYGPGPRPFSYLYRGTARKP